MKIVILWGTGKIGQKIYAKMKERYQIVAWIDKDKKKQHTLLKDVEVYPPEELPFLIEKFHVDHVVCAVDVNLVYDVASMIKKWNAGGKFAYVPKKYLMFEELENEFDLVELDFSKPILQYYEYHVCDHCNLKCKGCGHVSNVSEECFADIKSYENDLQRLCVLFSDCLRVKLLGGEPLLNPQLPEFIEITRKYFPNCDLRIGTNGLLIPKSKERLFNVMRKNHAYFFISLYPPVEKIQERIREKCDEQDVIYEFTPQIVYFSKALYSDKGNEDVKAIYKKCKARTDYCFNLRDGKITPCGSFYFKMLNEKFDAGFEITDMDEFDIYKIDDGWKLDELLHSPIPFCSYCVEPVNFKWEPLVEKNATLKDYVNDIG